MKKSILLLTFGFLSQFIAAQSTWLLDNGHSKVGFSVHHHLISEVDGLFLEYDAKIVSSSDDFSDATFEFTAQSASLETFHDLRDEHLSDVGYFDVEGHPEITFQSNSFKQIMGNEWRLTGDLTMKGKTLPVTMEVILGGPVFNKRAQTDEIGIKATGKINRLDFEIGPDLPEIFVSNEVELRILGEFRLQKGE